MALDKFDKANLNRLKACVRPNQNKIDKIKARVKKLTEEALIQVRELEEQNADFNKLIAEIEAKDVEEVNTSTEESANEEDYGFEEVEPEAEQVSNSPLGTGDFINDDFPY